MINQPCQPREIRLFLSSTFKDMETERDELVHRVLPQIRQLCLERNVNFSEIDLRWGITEDAAKNGRTVELCLDEIERCRVTGQPPFFIGFLGERYGWIPRHEDLADYWHERPDSPQAARIRNALDQEISVTDLEIQVAIQESEVNQIRARIYFRSPSLTSELALRYPEVNFFENIEKQEMLKQRIRGSGLLGIDGYSSVRQFGDSVLAYLRERIDALFPVEALPDVESHKARQHELYAQSRLRSYVPLAGFKSEVESEIRHAFMQSDSFPILIQASSGMGKSSFLADLTTMDDAEVFCHFTGADGDRVHSAWRDRLIAFLQRRLVTGRPWKYEGEDAAWFMLQKLLTQYSESNGGQLLLLLDAINQFASPDRLINSLEKLRIPVRVCLVISATHEIEGPTAWARLSLPHMNKAEKEQAIRAFLRPLGKELDGALESLLVNSVPCDSPLFLKILLDEIRLHARHETLPLDVSRYLSMQYPEAIFLDTLSALDSEFDFGLLGTRLVRLLAASHNGFSSSHLAGILANEASIDDDQRYVRKSRHVEINGCIVTAEESKILPPLPMHLIAPILARLSPYLMCGDGLYSINHQSLKLAFISHEYDTPARLSRFSIADYFVGHDAFSISERTHQFVQLKCFTSENHASLLSVISKVDDFILLVKKDPMVAKRAMIFAGNVPPKYSSFLGPLWRGDAEFDWVSSIEAVIAVGSWLVDESLDFPAVEWLTCVTDRPEVLKQVPHEIVANLYELLGDSQLSFGNCEISLDCYLTAIERLGASHVESAFESILFLKLKLASVISMMGYMEIAGGLVNEVRDALRFAGGGDDFMRAKLLLASGEVRFHQGENAAAARLISESLGILEANLSEGSPLVLKASGLIARSYAQLREVDNSFRILEKAMPLANLFLHPKHREMGGLYEAYGDLMLATGNYEAAENSSRFAENSFPSQIAVWSTRYVPTTLIGGRAMLSLGNSGSAYEKFRWALDTIERNRYCPSSRYRDEAIAGLALAFSKKVDSGLIDVLKEGGTVLRLFFGRMLLKHIARARNRWVRQDSSDLLDRIRRISKEIDSFRNTFS